MIMKYLVYNERENRFHLSDEKPPLVDSMDHYMLMENGNIIVRYSDYCASVAYDTSKMNQAKCKVHGEDSLGFISEGKDDNEQYFSTCKGFILYIYRRERKEDSSPWNEWELVKKVDLNSGRDL